MQLILFMNPTTRLVAFYVLRIFNGFTHTSFLILHTPIRRCENMFRSSSIVLTDKTKHSSFTLDHVASHGNVIHKFWSQDWQQYSLKFSQSHAARKGFDRTSNRQNAPRYTSDIRVCECVICISWFNRGVNCVHRWYAVRRKLLRVPGALSKSSLKYGTEDKRGLLMIRTSLKSFSRSTNAMPRSRLFFGR